MRKILEIWTGSVSEYISLAIIVVFPLCMILATFYDIFTMTIPNRLTFAVLLGYVVMAPLAGLGWETIAWSVALAAGVLVIGFFLFSFGIMGGGDAKLLAASTLWFGTAFTLEYVLMASILGGVLGIVILLWRRRELSPYLLTIQWIDRLHDKKTGIPYGAALGPAALMVFVKTPWMEIAINASI